MKKQTAQDTCEKYNRGRSAAPVCATSAVYARAVSHFADALPKHITQHEEEVFLARAYFELKRAEDREHHQRTQSKRLRSENVSGNLARHSVHNAAVFANETDEAEKTFLEDQKKLHLEHEEMLQQTYPLAFLDDKSLAILTSEFIRRLRGNLEALEEERTRRYRRSQNAAEESKTLLSAPEDDALLRFENSGETRDVHGRGNFFVKEERHLSATAARRVGRGAYIIPPAAANGASEIQKTARDGGAGATSGSDENEEERPRSPGDVDSERGPLSARGGAPWLSNIKSRGAAEFVRAAFVCNEKSRQERREEKRRFLETCLTEKTSSKERRRVEQLLQRLEKEAKSDATREAEIWRAWRAVVDNLDVNNNGAVVEGQKSTVEGKSNGRAAPADDEKAEICETLEDAVVCKAFTPSDLLNEKRQKRMASVNGLPEKTNNAAAASSPTPFSAGGDVVSAASDRWGFFDTNRWETITLSNGGEHHDEDSRCLEAQVPLYMWPRHIEANIAHVLCGEATPCSRRCLMFKQETPVNATQEGAEKTLDDDDDCTANDTRWKEDATVVALPRLAANVWLKIDALGDFVAGKGRFSQDSRPD